ncbi:MAG: hypothetical protein IJ361_01690 [Spirochaetaceae bacterium]|nr:hypothetical protein [Spirochaetaceae bacterium]
MNKKFILYCLIFFGTLHFAFSQEIEQEPINQIDELNSNISTLSQLELRNSAQMLINPTRDFQGIFSLFLPKSFTEKGTLGIASMKKLEKNKSEIQALALQMENSTKQNLYNTNEMEYKGSIAWALTTGFGVGNFTQGDIGFGSLFALADISSVALLVVGAINTVEKAMITDDTGWSLSLFFYSILPYPMLCIDLIVSLFTMPNNGASGMFPLLQGACTVLFHEDVFKTFLPWAIAGLGIKITSTVFQCVRAKTRATKYNRTLAEALMLDLDVENISFSPIINPMDKNFGLAVAIKI